MTDNFVTQSLIKTKEILSDKTRWIKLAAAKSKDGKRVPTNSDEAYAFCLNGALCHTQGTSRPKGAGIIMKAWLKIHPNTYPYGINHLNDRLIVSHKELIKVLDEAIELSKEEND